MVYLQLSSIKDSNPSAYQKIIDILNEYNPKYTLKKDVLHINIEKYENVEIKLDIDSIDNIKNMIKCISGKNEELQDCINKINTKLKKFDMICRIVISSENYYFKFYLKVIEDAKMTIFNQYWIDENKSHENFTTFMIDDNYDDINRYLSAVCNTELYIAEKVKITDGNIYDDDNFMVIYEKDIQNNSLCCKIFVYDDYNYVESEEIKNKREQYAKREKILLCEEDEVDDGFKKEYHIHIKCICCCDKLVKYLREFYPMLLK